MMKYQLQRCRTVAIERSEIGSMIQKQLADLDMTHRRTCMKRGMSSVRISIATVWTSTILEQKLDDFGILRKTSKMKSSQALDPVPFEDVDVENHPGLYD